MKKLLMSLVMAGLALVAFTGCNTMEGAGQDVERAGEKIKDAAD